MTPPRKQKIAILGGGVASLSAALELTAHEGWQELYEVTVYQLGWRLGGKCATGRGPNGRIEEVGIHIMQGWYHNMNRLMDRVYQERQRFGLSPDDPSQRFRDTLIPVGGTVFADWSHTEKRWTTAGVNFPFNDEPPGEVTHEAPWRSMGKFIALGAHLSTGLLYRDQESLLPRLQRLVLKGIRLEDQLRRLNQLAGTLQPGDSAGFRMLHGLLRTVFSALEATVPGTPGDGSNAQRLLGQIELLVVILRGLLDEVWDEEREAFDFDSINHLDYRAWLKKHGASARVLESSTVRFSYTGMFANLCDGPGASGQGGLVAAGSALRVLLLAVGYRGDWVASYRSGTGDTVILPMYDVLRHRGVRFAFFHDVRQVHASETGEIERITVDEQVTLKDGSYDPAILVHGVRCWPAQPRWEHLDPAQGARLQAERIDLESPWTPWKSVLRKELRRGEEFDQVILGIPVAALKDTCSEIIAREPRWKAMVEGVRTTQTLNAQLWTKPTMAQMGMLPERFGLLPGTLTSTVVYQSPLISWADMSCVLPAEAWSKQGGPGAVAYFSGAFEDAEPTPPASDYTFPAREQERAVRTTEEWLRYNMAFFWPLASSREYPAGFDARHLQGTLREQHLRSNPEPSNRYTLSVPGSDKLRMRAEESGYRNLFLTGDWTDFGVNVGYVEGGIISGMRTAQALRTLVYGCKVHSPISTDVDLTPRGTQPARAQAQAGGEGEKQEQRRLREVLAPQVGSIEPAIVDKLIALGVHARSVVTLELVPLVLVAWADGTLDAGEREVILAVAEGAGLARGTEGRILLERWLARRPGPQLFEVWQAWVDGLASSLSQAEWASLSKSVLARAREVAEAAGGLLGRGAISASERRVLEALEEALAQ